MPANGALNHWYFEKGTCDSIDNKYNISKTNKRYGGLIYYNVANTDIFWGGLNTDRITDCEYCENKEFNFIKPEFCNKLSCNFNIGGASQTITPSSCKTKSFQAEHPLQYIAFNTLVADDKYINNTDKGDSGWGGYDNYKNQHILQKAKCQYSLNVNGNISTYSSTTDVATSVNNWHVVGNKISKNDSVSVDVTGAYSQTFGFGGTRAYVLSAETFFTLGIGASKCDYLAGTDDGFVFNNKNPYRDFGTKNCRATTVFALKKIPFVSCFAGYKNGCSNVRNPSIDKSDEVTGCGSQHKYIDLDGKDQTVAVGACKKTINGNVVPQKYSNFSTQRVNTLIDSSGPFSVAENVRNDHCGVCIASGLPSATNTSYPLVSVNDFSPITNNAISTADDCRNNPNYQWTQSYVDADTKNIITYTPYIKSVSSFCVDSHKIKQKSDPLVSLTSLFHSNRYSDDVVYGEIGKFTDGVPIKTSSSMIYRVPENMDGSSISFGIAGSGKNVDTMYSSSDKTANDKGDGTYNNVNILVQTGKVAHNGKYLFFYIQPYTKDANGNYTTTLDPNLHPNIIFAGLTHDEIYKKGTANPTNPLIYDFYQEDLSSGGSVSADGIIDGATQIIPPKTGKLWSAILDISPKTIEPYDVTNGKDRDGRAIIYKKSVVGDPGVSTDYSNTISWNTGTYSVIVKAKKPKTQVSELGSTLITGIVNFIKTLFFGPVTQGNCVTVATPGNDVVSTQVYNNKEPSQPAYVPQYCTKDNIMKSSEVIPSILSSAANLPISTFYKCQQNNDKYKCSLFYKDKNNNTVDTKSTPVDMLILRYGDCNTGASQNGNVQICNVYQFKQTNASLDYCLRQDYSDVLCWDKTTRIEKISAPYTYIKNNDMLPGNIMPLCNTDEPYKSYTNCNMIAGKQTCDINRDCFPGSNGTSVQSAINVPIFISQGDDLGVNGVSADAINKISNCQTQSPTNIQSAYCVTDSQDLGYQKCDFSVAQSAKCATCTRPTISSVSLNSNSVSSIGHQCTSTTDSLFYCDTNAYNACLSQSQGNSNNQPDIIFDEQQTDVIKICDISSISPNANTRIAKSVIQSQLPLSICSVERSCTYTEYKPLPIAFAIPLDKNPLLLDPLDISPTDVSFPSIIFEA